MGKILIGTENAPTSANMKLPGQEVGYAALENDPTIFNKNAEPDRIFKGGKVDDSKGFTGWERILNNYKNGGNK